MPGDSLVLIRYVKDEICHQMLVPSDKVGYKSKIGIDKKVLISHTLRYRQPTYNIVSNKTVTNYALLLIYSEARVFLQ